MRTNDKQRFAISDDDQRIRASQGHSVAVELGLEPQAPPPVLFHGTVERNLDGHCQGRAGEGSARQHVHLSPDLETATRVGARRGRPVILTIESAAWMQDAGLKGKSAPTGSG